MKEERRQEEKRRREQQQRRAARTRRFMIIAAAALVVLVSAISVYAYARAHKANNQATTSALPTEQVFNSAYPPMDGIYCDKLEQTAYHIHAHLTIYINGQNVPVPQGIGIASDQSCFYWLHTHTSDGVIHIEAPAHSTFTLANFLDIWEVQFSQLGFRTELASSDGWTIYVNGKQVKGDFKSVTLTAHELITMMYNSPKAKPDTIYSWQPGL